MCYFYKKFSFIKKCVGHLGVAGLILHLPTRHMVFHITWKFFDGFDQVARNKLRKCNEKGWRLTELLARLSFALSSVNRGWRKTSSLFKINIHLPASYFASYFAKYLYLKFFILFQILEKIGDVFYNFWEKNDKHFPHFQLFTK